MNQSNENHLRETEAILKESTRARDDDTYLAILIWTEFHREEWFELCKAVGPQSVYEALSKLPKIDSIKRYRRTLRDKYPSSKEAEEQRRKQEQESKHYYAANGQGMMFKPQYEI